MVMAPNINTWRDLGVWDLAGALIKRIEGRSMHKVKYVAMK
jgi:hypothetical protein